MRERVEFEHDTHRLMVIPSPSKKYRIVSSGVGHFTGGGHFDPDASCQACEFSINEGTACTIRMSMQLRCERLLSGDCCRTYGILKFLEPCKGGKEVEWVGDDGTWRSGVNEKGKIFAIPRADGGTIPVPPDGLCHAFQKKKHQKSSR